MTQTVLGIVGITPAIGSFQIPVRIVIEITTDRLVHVVERLVHAVELCAVAAAVKLHVICHSSSSDDVATAE